MLLLKSVLLKNLKHQTLIILSGDILTPQYFKHPTNNSHFFLSLSSYHIILSILPIFFSLTRCLLALGCQNISFQLYSVFPYYIINWSSYTRCAIISLWYPWGRDVAVAQVSYSFIYWSEEWNMLSLSRTPADKETA